MAFTVIPNSDIDPGSPGSTDLFTKFRDNDDFLFDRQAGLVLVEKKLVTGDVSLLTFSGLDGNTDEIYKLVGRIRVTGTAPEFTLEPNGISTNQDSLLVENGIQVSSPANLMMSNGIGATHPLQTFEAIFWAKANPNSIATNRLLQSIYSVATATAMVTTGQAHSVWDEDSTNITSLDVVSSIASDIRDGSTVALYKLRQV